MTPPVPPMPLTWLDYERRRNPTPPLVELPARFAAARVTDLWPGAVKDVAIEYVTRFLTVAPTGVAPLFLGRARTGKTTAAAGILRAVNLGYGVEAAFCPVPVAWARYEAQRFRAETEAAITTLEQVPFLVLDDIGVIRPDTYGHQLLTRIVAARFDALKPTCMTGNLDLGDEGWAALARCYGPLLARRFEECATGYTVPTD